jgi:hypothetical protein
MQLTRPTVKFTAAALGIALGAAVLAPTFARAADDEVPIDAKILQSILEGLGLRKDGQATIDYQERAPLVVPPNRDLPPPERDGVALRNNPAWPNDPDIARARADAAQRRNRNIQAEMEKEQNPLRRDELDPPATRASRRTASQGSSGELSPDITGRYRLTPQELGTKSFFGLFGKSDPEVKRFTGEPARTALTKPPAGYQVPSPDQPYGLGKEVVKQKATNYLETHGTVDADR